MADQAQTDRVRVALIFGDAAAVKHLRDSVSAQVELVYDAQAADFDVARLVAAHAHAALVNLDSFEWLDTIGAQLSKAGVAVVFNDPEISSQLDGWEHARWLRHLVAKLRGSDDYDPPRPAFGVAAPVAEAPIALAPKVAAAASVPAPTPEATAMPSAAEPVPAVADTPIAPPAAIDFAPLTAPPAAVSAVELPLSAREIDTLTVDFAAAPAPLDAAVAPAHDDPMPDIPAAAAAPMDPDASDLDVDTEALSAMIDARLAEPEQHVPEAATAWQSDTTVEAVDVAAAVPPPAVPVVDAAAPPADAPRAAPPPDDSDVLADLPALDDWQLLDPDAPAAPVASVVKHAEPASPTLSDELSALELVPMEHDVPIELHSEPIEHRLYVEARKQQAAAERKTTDANGDQA